ncbi:MAG: AI-2E family transporter [Alistipes sp.]|nr:AI-2E family transporter [Alistipes sp.]
MNITLQNILKFGVGLAIAAVVLFLVWYFSAIVVYILVSAVLAIIGRPLVDLLANRGIRGFLFPRWAAAAITLLVMMLAIGAVISVFVPVILQKINDFASVDFSAVLSRVEQPVMYVQQYIEETFALQPSDTSLTTMLAEECKEFFSFDFLNSTVTSVVSIALSAVVAFFSVAFITFFFLKEDGLFYAMVCAMFPSHLQDNVVHALDSITHLLSRYFVGIVTESVILMVVISLVMRLFGVELENAMLMGLIMGIMNVIPYAGPLIGGVICVFMGIMTPIEGYSSATTAVIVVVSLLCIKGIDDFILQPTIYSERVKAHPLEVFLVILLAGYVAGIWGMLLAIPSYTVVRVLAKEFFSEFSLVQKLTRNL